MGMADRIKKRRIAMNYTQEELAQKLGLQKSAIAKYENGRVENIKRSIIARMAELLECSPAYLMGWEDDCTVHSKSSKDDIYTYDNIYHIELKKFPLLGEIACGEPIFCNEDRESYILAGTDIKADFCLKARGGSMINARIYDGDVVFIKEQPLVNDGEIAAVIIENEATLKRVYFDRNNNTLQLVAENPAYRPMVYVGESLNSIRILGKAVAFQSDVK